MESPKPSENGTAVAVDDAPGDPSRPLAGRSLVIGLGLVALMVVALTGLAMSLAMARAHTTAEARLHTIADLRASQVAMWLGERRADGEFLVSSRYLQALLAKRSASDAAVRDQAQLEILQRLDDARRIYGYQAVYLADAASGTASSVGGSASLEPRVKDALAHSAATGTVETLGPYRDRDGAVWLDVVAPLASSDGRHTASIVLRVDPKRSLFPMLQAWPTPTESGESLLERRAGDVVEILSEPRFSTDAAANRRIPLGDERRLAT
ncbi:MAG: cache domain-containing protein, partial [Deltaproteobacteria bacterium]|nr:cache domain-containing protein [Deltaproteobacteria bacterium]